MDGSRVSLRTPEGAIRLELPLPGLYNVYNALAAVAAGLELGLEPGRIASALADMRAAFGRVETIDVGGIAALDPADQEPGGRERGPAHAAPRGG